ncbi:MAG: helix-turn-helix domain-containing protein [Protaetiibacter sp.]
MMPTHDIVQRQFDEMRVVRIRGGVRRSAPQPSPLERERWPHLLVYAARGAVQVLRHDVTTRLDGGGFAIIPNDSEFTVESDEDAVVLVLLMPLGAVAPYRRSFEQLGGRVFTAHEGTTHLVGHLLGGLAMQLPELAAGHPGQLARHIVGFVALACADDAGTRPGGAIDSILDRAREYIEQHLGDLELSPERIARVHNVSVRTLHRLFENEQLTVGGWIRERRLDHCRSDLENTGCDHESVSAIGARWGFWDAAHFSRLFKTRYGMSPRAYRATRAERRESPALASA